MCIFLLIWLCVYSFGEWCVVGQYEVPLENSSCRELLWLPLAGFYTVWLPSVLKWLRSSFQTPIMHNAFKYIIQAVFCVHFYSCRWCLVRQFAQGHEVKWLSEHLQTSILISSQPCLKHTWPKRLRFSWWYPADQQLLPFPSTLSYGSEERLPRTGECRGRCTLSGICLGSASSSAELPGLSQSQAETLGSLECCTSGS